MSQNPGFEVLVQQQVHFTMVPKCFGDFEDSDF